MRAGAPPAEQARDDEHGDGKERGEEEHEREPASGGGAGAARVHHGHAQARASAKVRRHHVMRRNIFRGHASFGYK